MEEKVKTSQEVEAPEDLKETPKQGRWNKRVILIISVFLALAIFGTIAYLSRTKTPTLKPIVQTVTPAPSYPPVATPNPSVDTSNWKTYISNAFSFKYDPSWKLESESPKIIFTKSVIGGNASGGKSTYTASLNISSYPTNSTTTLKDMFEKYYPVEKLQILSDMLNEWTTPSELNNEKALYFTETGCCNSYGNGIMVIHNNVGYVIRMDGAGGIRGSNLDGAELLNGVISTFKFTNSNTFVGYTANPKLKFSLNIPDSCTKTSQGEHSVMPGADNIKCNGMIIIPAAGGHGMGEGPGIKLTVDTSSVALGNYKWKRDVLSSNTAPQNEKVAIYTLQGNTYLLIEVDYSEYSTENQNLAESTISSLKFTN